MVFPFVPSRAFLIINIDVNGLHTFCGGEDLLIPTSYKKFHKNTKKHPKTHESNDLTTISIEIIRDNF
jgi:hypothetical protein